MLAVWIGLTHGHWNKFIDCQKAKVRSAALPSMNVKIFWHSTLELLERANQLREITQESFQNPKYCDHQPLFTTQDEWTMVKYIMEVLRPFRYWTLWMSKRHMVPLHHVITVYNDMFNHMDAIMRDLAMKKTGWTEDLFFAVKLARQMLSKDYSEVTPTTGKLVTSAHILDLFQKLQSWRTWDNGMNINPEGETSCTTQYQEAFLKYMDNEYYAKHRHVPVNKPNTIPNNNLVPCTMASASGQSSVNR